jgi:hypothetical protein
METALKKTTAYSIGTFERENADVKFESAFQTAEKCWGKYYKCAGRCHAPKRCIATCQSKFKKCFAAAETRMKEGPRAMKGLKFASPEWEAAYAKGGADSDRCLESNRDCQAKCANP